MERIVYDQVCANGKEGHYFMFVHLQAYTWAYQFLHKKVVLDAACGTGFGTMIYSTCAESIIAVDKDAESLEHAKKLNSFCPVTYLKRDLDNDLLPKADVCVSVETIEHLENHGFFLRNLDVKNLIFTVPINMGGRWHKIVFKDEQEVIDYLRFHGWWPIHASVQDTTVISDVDPNNKFYVLNSRMMMGVAERISK